MGDKTPATTTQQNQSTTTADPWSAATPLLNNLIGNYLGTSTAVTPAQTAAGQNLTSAAAGIPNLTPQSTAAVQQIFGNAGMLPQAYQTTQANLGGLASSNPDPYSDPGMAGTLAAIQKNVTNAVKGTYAGSGREPSGAGDFAGSLAQGLSAGMAPVVMGQYNTDLTNKLAANQQLTGAATGTSSGMNSWLQSALQGAGMLPGMQMAPATAQWGAANAVQGQPIANINQLLSPASMLGGMGGTTQATGNMMGQQTPANDPWANILGGVSGAAGLIGAFSDPKLKTDVKDIGRTHDKQKIYSYRFKGSNVPQIGLMADEVEKKTPEAVSRDPATGYKRVNYNLATRKAATMGMLRAA